MPPAINLRERLDAIAMATLEITREHGARGVTIRAVATRLGGSTTLVTKYLPSRAALLANANRYMSAHWSSDEASALGRHTGIDRLRALARWSLNTEGYDDAIRKLWIDALAAGHTSLAREEARSERDNIQAIVNSALPAEESDWLADALFLAFRGYYLSTIEDPEQWSPTRGATAIERLLDLIEANDRRSRHGGPRR